MEDIQTVMTLPHTPGNPRNSEGAFVTLRDGRILFAYSRFEGESGSDEGCAVICGLVSADSGRTWEALPAPLVEQEGGLNVMSVSLLRLQDGRLAMFYLRKNSLADCQLYMRTSTDEGVSWINPTRCTMAQGYHVVNNDRVIQLQNGALLVPATLHRTFVAADGSTGDDWRGVDGQGVQTFFRSDDAGATWRSAGAWWATPTGVGQEVGVIEHADGVLTSWCRTNLGCQWAAISRDGAASWSTPQPTTFRSPCAPMSMKRNPATGDLVVVWDDLTPHWGAVLAPRQKGFGADRSPLAIALSKDDSKTWLPTKLLEDDMGYGYCYIAIHFTDDAVLLAYCCGEVGKCLADSKIVRVPFAWLE